MMWNPINPINVEGQIEGGVVMSLGYALTEDYPLVDSMPKVKYGTLGLFRATQVPEIKAVIVKKDEQNPRRLWCKRRGRNSKYTYSTGSTGCLLYV